MANSKISALTSAATPLAGTETLPVVQSGATKQVSVANLTSGRDVGTQALTASGAIWSTGSSGLPASTGSNAYQTGGYGSPITGRLFIGDGTGWSYYFSKRNSSVNTDLYQFADNGNLSLLTGNLVQGTAAKGVNFTANTGAAGMTSQLLNWYEEGTWTPTFGNLTVIGTPTYTGKYTRIGRQVTFTLRVQSTTTTQSGFGATFFNLPIGTPINPSTLTAVQSLAGATYGVGLIYTDGNGYTPTWAANADVTISGTYFV